MLYKGFDLVICYFHFNIKIFIIIKCFSKTKYNFKINNNFIFIFMVQSFIQNQKVINLL